jgi:hypothetical protein
MANNVVPDTENGHVAMLAIAWEIVKTAYGARQNDTDEHGVTTLTNAVIKAYQALNAMTPISGK